MMETGTAISADGTPIFYRDTGRTDLPTVVLIHGYMQNSLSWQFQLGDEALTSRFRLIAIDLRGHGRSGKPTDPAAYSKSTPWADDVAAVLESLALERAVLAGWSYGGYVIADYLRHHGSEKVAGIGMVGSTLWLGGDAAARYSHPENGTVFQGVVSGDVEKNVPALEAFVRALTAEPVGDPLHYEFMGYGAAVPRVARLVMLSRVVDNGDIAAETPVPVWIPHGDSDAIILAKAGEDMAKTFPNGTLSLYQGVGHTPFVEAPERFNRELAAFAESVFS